MEKIKQKTPRKLSAEKLEAKKKRDTEKYKQLLVLATSLGFIRISKRARRRYISEVVPLEPPRDKRDQDADNQVVLKLEINGYAIWFYTGYLEEEEQFATDKATQIVVTKSSKHGGKVHYNDRYYDTPYKVRNVGFGLQFIVNRLSENRPTLLGKPADIYDNEQEGIYEWRSVYKKKGCEPQIETAPFYENLPPKPAGLIKFIYKHRDEKIANAKARILEKRTPLKKIKRVRKKLPINRSRQMKPGVVQLTL